VRRWIASILLLASVTALLGCGAQDDRVRIRIWHQKDGAERPFFEAAVVEYNRMHPDRRVEVLYRETEELRNLFIVGSVGGSGPELVFGPSDNVSIFAITESARRIDDVLSPAFLSQFSEDGLVSWEGVPYMIADQVGNHLAFVYNRRLLPRAPETTDEMLEMLGRVMREDRTGNVYGLTWNYSEPFFFVPFLTCFGGWFMDAEGNPTLDTPETVKAIRFILDLRDQHRVIPRQSDYNVAETLFKDQRSASIINGPWAWAGYGVAGVDYRVAPLPVSSETGLPCAPLVSARGYTVNANVDDEKLPYIAHLLEYLTGPDMQRGMAEHLSTIPVIESVRNSAVVRNNPILQASLQQAELGRPMPLEPQMRQIWDGMRGPYQLVMNGAVSPEEGARLMQRNVEARIRDAQL
jgi:maltose-binding protein MalE